MNADIQQKAIEVTVNLPEDDNIFLWVSSVVLPLLLSLIGWWFKRHPIPKGKNPRLDKLVEFVFKLAKMYLSRRK